jgi:redox-sensing transcriptional repressor
MANRGKIPSPTVKRLSLYLRELESQAETGRGTISSRQLGEALGLTDAQVRKDLAYFGQFGHPGIGYHVPELTTEIRRILGTDQMWSAALVGVGNIGRAVISYGRLRGKGFEIVEAFDNDPNVIGTVVAGCTVRSLAEMDGLLRAHELRMALLAVPAAAAQEVTDRLVEAGIAGILNFAPVRLRVPDRVSIVSVDLTVSLEQLAFRVSATRTA